MMVDDLRVKVGDLRLKFAIKVEIVETVMGKRAARWARPDISDIVANLQVQDEVMRGDAVRSLCPCHAGWDLFEEHIAKLHQLLRDPKHLVRRHALHVFEDAARMQSAGELDYYVYARQESLGEKRSSSRYRSMDERFEARIDRQIRKNKQSRRIKSEDKLLDEIYATGQEDSQ